MAKVNPIAAHYGEKDLLSFAKKQARIGNYYNAYKALLDHTNDLAAPRPAPKADSALVGELRGLLESASPGPWAYRPDEFDDWGAIRGPEKTVEWADYPVRPFVAQARHSDIQDEEFLVECRKTKTDPWADDAKLIVWLRNHADTILAALRAQEAHNG